MREAGLGPATDIEVELSPMVEFHAQSTRTCQGRRTGHSYSFLNLSLQGSLVFTQSNSLRMPVIRFSMDLSDGIYNS